MTDLNETNTKQPTSLFLTSLAFLEGALLSTFRTIPLVWKWMLDSNTGDMELGSDQH